jgi:enamine deaminase RidA (YjgF/YER057c/UK114 family)
MSSGAEIDAKIAALGYKLPPPSVRAPPQRRAGGARALFLTARLLAHSPLPQKPVASYVMASRVGNLIYTAGHLPVTPEGAVISAGKVGSADVTTEQGTDAARAVALNILATLRSELGGDLGRVRRVVKVTAFVNCVDSFAAQPKVVNGCSDLLVAVFGDAGKHARSAVGVNALPLNVPVEIEAIVEVD